MRPVSLLILCLAISVFSYGQQDTSAKALPVVVGFYNLENLFDTVDNGNIDDAEFLPESPKKYNTTKYFDKIGRLADVISQIGKNYSPDGLALMGCAEIENDTVLTDLVLHEKLSERGYQFIQFNSPDNRGIDVGLIYNPVYFTVLGKSAVHVELPTHYPTRDILYVKGILLGDTIHVLVNHWPSRSGGNNFSDVNNKENLSRNSNNGRAGNMSNSSSTDAGLGGSNNNFKKYMGDAGSTTGYREALITDGEENTRFLRLAAAKVCRSVIDSVLSLDNNSRILIMGDLNDDPGNLSVTNGIQAKLDIKKIEAGDIYNPWGDILKQGYGTLAFGGKWNLFDQIMFSSAWLNQTGDMFLYKNHIYYNEQIINKTEPYKGYPKRSWAGNIYNFGYSDHLPVYSVLLKRL